VFDKVSKVVLRDRRNIFASFSEDELHFSWHAQHFGGKRSTSDELRCVFIA
jgi:hypothetical protein